MEHAQIYLHQRLVLTGWRHHSQAEVSHTPFAHRLRRSGISQACFFTANAKQGFGFDIKVTLFKQGRSNTRRKA